MLEEKIEFLFNKRMASEVPTHVPGALVTCELS